MTSQDLRKIDIRRRIDIKRPRYLTKYTSLMEAISIKGTTKGGDYIKFGQFWQTYMYAFMIGYHLGENIPITDSGDKRDFFPFGEWKPAELRDFILTMVLNESAEKLRFDWIQLEEMNEEDSEAAVVAIVRRIEGYANVGLSYLQDKFDNEKEEFRDPFVFVNLLRKITDGK